MTSYIELEKAISPISLSSFENDYFEKKPLLISRENPSYFRDLLSIEDIDTYLERKDIRYPAIRLVKDGLELPQTDYLKNLPFGNQTFDRVIDNDRLFTLFGEGATIVFQALHRTLAPLSLFCQKIEKYFSFPLQTNIYLTPQTSQGFAAHYDNHDVFIFQTHGSKLWKVYDSPIYLPTKPFDKKNWTPTLPQIEVELKEGDTLYIPRGYVHEAFTTNNVSLHITLGLLTYTWIDILRLLTAGSHKIEKFRDSYRFDKISEEETKTKMKLLVNQLIDSADYSAVKNEFQTKLIKKALSSDSGRIKDLININDLTLNSSLSVRDEINFSITSENEYLIISFYNKRISLPFYVTDTITEILNLGSFKIGNIGNKLDDSSKLLLCSKLLKEGLLKLNYDV